MSAASKPISTAGQDLGSAVRATMTAPAMVQARDSQSQTTMAA
jgi:hypothetical protein